MALGRIIISIKIMRRTLFSPLVLFYNILKKKEDLLLFRDWLRRNLRNLRLACALLILLY